jgi:hypothetical protein
MNAGLAGICNEKQLSIRGRSFVYSFVEADLKWAYVEVTPGVPALIHTVPNHGEGRMRAHLKSLVDGRAQRRAQRAERRRQQREERYQRMLTAITRNMGSRIVAIGEARGYLACFSRKEQAKWVKLYMPPAERLEWMRRLSLVR